MVNNLSKLVSVRLIIHQNLVITTIELHGIIVILAYNYSHFPMIPSHLF